MRINFLIIYDLPPKTLTNIWGQEPRILLWSWLLPRFSQTRELESSKAAFTIAFFAAVNHNCDHKQRTLKHRNTQNGSNPPITDHKPWLFEPIEVLKGLFHKRSATMIDGSGKRKRAFGVWTSVFLKSVVKASNFPWLEDPTSFKFKKNSNFHFVTLKNKWDPAKLLLKRSHFKGHT